tara:strand:- start:501 stop:1400 length:900 start_codon:yes stop_codon:yes gene_type:complete
MKNKLAENMLRFGTKNLTESQQQKLLLEQTSIRTGDVKIKLADYKQGFLKTQYQNDRGIFTRDDIDYGIFIATGNVNQVNPTFKVSEFGAGGKAVPVQKTVNLEFTFKPFISGITSQFFDNNKNYANKMVNTMTIESATIKGSEDSENLWPSPSVSINQTAPTSGGKIQFNIPMNTPIPQVATKYVDGGTNIDRNQDGSAKMYYDNKNFGTITLKGSINSSVTDRATWIAGVEKAIASGRLKDKDQGKARIAKWDATNPSGKMGGEATPFTLDVRIDASDGRKEGEIGYPQDAATQQRG